MTYHQLAAVTLTASWALWVFGGWLLADSWYTHRIVVQRGIGNGRLALAWGVLRGRVALLAAFSALLWVVTAQQPYPGMSKGHVAAEQRVSTMGGLLALVVLLGVREGLAIVTVKRTAQLGVSRDEVQE